MRLPRRMLKRLRKALMRLRRALMRLRKRLKRLKPLLKLSLIRQTTKIIYREVSQASLFVFLQ